MVAMSLELKERLAKVNRQGRHARDFRIGIDSARVFAGVIGEKEVLIRSLGRQYEYGLPNRQSVVPVQHRLPVRLHIVRTSLIKKSRSASAVLSWCRVP
jgi:hypothetical protein